MNRKNILLAMAFALIVMALWPRQTTSVLRWDVNAFHGD